MNFAPRHFIDQSLAPSAKFTWQLRFSVGCLGAAVALSPLTALRFFSGVGPTDIFLGISLIATLILLRVNPAVLSESKVYQPGSVSLYRFWILTLPFLVFTTLLNAALSGTGYNSYLQQLIPYFPAALLVFSMHAIAARPFLLHLLIKHFLIMSFIVGFIYSALVTAQVSSFYLEDIRFMGFSENPNQVADESFATILVCLIYPILFPNLSTKLKYLTYVTGCFALIYGIASDAATFFLALLFVAGLYGSLLFARYMKTNTILAFFGLLAMVMIILFNEAAIVDHATSFVDSALQHKQRGDEDVIRYILWENGIDAGMASPIIGNGAGAWSGLQAPFHATESHNTFIDWFSITGFPGLALWLFEIGVVMFRFRWSNPAPQIFFAGLIIFSFFHFVFRHPFFWFAAMLCAMATLAPMAEKRRAKMAPAFHPMEYES